MSFLRVTQCFLNLLTYHVLAECRDEMLDTARHEYFIRIRRYKLDGVPQ